ncbi:hypothetical protein CTAYLR_004048 [Chrysophaeum taylorii]|uniref:Pseudouridine synthase RsuA/RluA-like domain-containing protein n=1 Tax=Chrysophaeum taylorii TaxID=2483200 RepID=A0AAD7UPA8_9STRA|nr:hypothetical protein CTAYLR_004048 [Chrysophaeum taylorii]
MMRVSDEVVEVVWWDAALVVVNKPPNMLSVPGTVPGETPRKRKRRSEYWREAIATHAESKVLRVGNLGSIPRSRDKFLDFAKRRGTDGASLWAELDRDAKAREDFECRCALTHATRRFGELRPAHRLDFETSGVLMFARTHASAAAVCEMFRDRKVRKTYVAVVRGLVREPSGVWSWAIERDERRDDKPRYVAAATGKPAVTEWRVLSAADNTTRLELCPWTGRSHQLRVHCARAGHPILGDPIYDAT